MTLQAQIQKFVDDLTFENLCEQAVKLGLTLELDMWLDDDYPDKEAKLRVNVAQAMIGDGK